MRVFNRQLNERLFIAVLYGLAMLLMPLAHRPVRQSAPDLSAYELPDGTLPLLCSPAKGGGSRSQSIAVCDACLLTAAPGLIIGGLAISAPAVSVVAVLEAPYEIPSFKKRFDSDARPRAPPSVLA